MKLYRVLIQPYYKFSKLNIKSFYCKMQLTWDASDKYWPHRLRNRLICLGIIIDESNKVYTVAIIFFYYLALQFNLVSVWWILSSRDCTPRNRNFEPINGFDGSVAKLSTYWVISANYASNRTKHFWAQI